jgi:hypothetical protein
MKKNEILMTMNYGIFKFYEKNREVSPKRVQNLIASIKRIDLTSKNPIIVNEKMEIVDGQHRYEACKEMGIPIFYVKANLKGQMDSTIVDLNDNQTQWTVNDYILSHTKRGKKAYQDILDCKDKYNCTTSTAISFVGNTENSGSSSIRKGTFKRGSIHYDVFGDIYLDFKEIFKDYAHVFFIRALVYAVKSGKYNHELDFKRFSKHRYDLKGCANYAQYLEMFEDILNRNRRGDKISFK